MEDLPVDVIVLIALDMDTKDVISLCQTRSRLRDSICNNADFWRSKIVRDLGVQIQSNDPKMLREYYIKSNMDVIWEKLRPLVDLWSDINFGYCLYKPGNIFELLYGYGNGNHDHFGVHVLGGFPYAVPHYEELERVREIESSLAEIFEYELEEFPHPVELTYESLMKFKPEKFVEYFDGISTDDIQNWPTEYVRIMNLHEEYTNLDMVRHEIRKRTDKTILWFKSELENEIDGEFEKLRLSDEDIENLTELHRQVLNGIISITSILPY